MKEVNDVGEDFSVEMKQNVSRQSNGTWSVVGVPVGAVMVVGQWSLSLPPRQSLPASSPQPAELGESKPLGGSLGSFAAGQGQPNMQAGDGWESLQWWQSKYIQTQKDTTQEGEQLKQMNHVCKRTNRWKQN